MGKQADNVASLPVSLRLGHVVMLLSHVHVASGVGRIRLSTVVKASELLVQLLGCSSVDLFPLGCNHRLVPEVVDHVF